MADTTTTAKKPAKAKIDGESAVLAAIATMSGDQLEIAQRLHAVISAAAPELTPKTWYGMPAYAKDGTVVCFFRGGDKFKERYVTLGFNDAAVLDEGNMWSIYFAITRLTAAEEKKVTQLVQKAVR